MDERRLIPVACTLDESDLPDRLAQWRAVVASATGRSDLADNGARLELPADTDVADLARLVAAEETCCAFFSFAITLDPRGLGLEVRAPADAAPLVAELLGETAAAD